MACLNGVSGGIFPLEKFMTRRIKNKSSLASRKRKMTPAAKVSPVTEPGKLNPRMALQAAIIVVLGLWIFWPAMQGQWIGDDRLYIKNNPLLHDPAGLWKAWFQPGSFIEYYPVHESLLRLQWTWWQNETFGYHLTNVLLHILSAFLLWRLLHRLGLKRGWLGGLIFLVHPMTVDSVALVNEFKTSLSLPPFLMAMLAWIDYEESKDRRSYLLALGLFLVAMLCKITMMDFPLVILLYAWWKRGKVDWKDGLASVPFWGISVLLGLASIYAGQRYEPESAGLHPDPLVGHPTSRFILMGEIILFYISRCFLPTTPMPIYPQWSYEPGSVLCFLPWLILAATLAYLYLNRSAWGRHALLGLGFFLIMLAPFSGVHWISYMKSTWVLEHLLYLPMIGLIGLVVAAFDHVYEQLSLTKKKAAVAIMFMLVALLAGQSESYASKFRDEETLARYTIEHNPHAYQSYLGLAMALLYQGRVYEAIDVDKACLELDPRNADVQNSLGNLLEMTGDLRGAVEHFQLALQIEPESAAFHCDLGNALQLLGLLPEAMNEFQQSLKLDPHTAGIYYNYGLCLSKAGREADAREEYQTALSLDPDLFQAHEALGASLLAAGHKSEAVEQFKEALRINPNDQETRAELEAAQRISAPP